MLPYVQESIAECMSAIEDGSDAILVCDEVNEYNMDRMVVTIGTVLCSVNKSVWTSAVSLFHKYDARYHKMITGYATGGAVALALAVIVANGRGTLPDVCSFGAPPVGDGAFVQEATCIRHLRVKLSEDIIGEQGLALRHDCALILIGAMLPFCGEVLASRICCALGYITPPVQHVIYFDRIRGIIDQSDWIDI